MEIRAWLNCVWRISRPRLARSVVTDVALLGSALVLIALQGAAR